ncbi:Hypothetical protein A7982_03169 [Minicystis rosea]|nr:Hypothetical protein A7982_03169 [Minicystis rosea]
MRDEPHAIDEDTLLALLGRHHAAPTDELGQEARGTDLGDEARIRGSRGCALGRAGGGRDSGCLGFGAARRACGDDRDERDRGRGCRKAGGRGARQGSLPRNRRGFLGRLARSRGARDAVSVTSRDPGPFAHGFGC